MSYYFAYSEGANSAYANMLQLHLRYHAIAIFSDTEEPKLVDVAVAVNSMFQVSLPIYTVAPH
jgi:hypothetical protein